MEQSNNNKVTDGISASELEKNNDYCLTNLKILSKITVGDKLCFDSNTNKFTIDEWSWGQPLTRWWSSEGRKGTIKSLEDFIAIVFKHIDTIYSSEIKNTYDDVNNTYYTNITTAKHVFREENSTQLLSFINEMRNAIGGISNLKQTYVDDVSTVSSLDIVIEKLNVRVKKIQGVLQISRKEETSE